MLESAPCTRINGEPSIHTHGTLINSTRHSHPRPHHKDKHDHDLARDRRHEFPHITSHGNCPCDSPGCATPAVSGLCQTEPLTTGVLPLINQQAPIDGVYSSSQCQQRSPPKQANRQTNKQFLNISREHRDHGIEPPPIGVADKKPTAA